jgi:hypothetical protein
MGQGIGLVQILAKSLLGWGRQMVHVRMYLYMYLCCTFNSPPLSAIAHGDLSYGHETRTGCRVREHTRSRSNRARPLKLVVAAGKVSSCYRGAAADSHSGYEFDMI